MPSLSELPVAADPTAEFLLRMARRPEHKERAVRILLRLSEPRVLKGGSLQAYAAMRDQAEKIFASTSLIDHVSEARVIRGSPRTAQQFDYLSNTMTVRSVGRRVLEGYLGGHYRLSGKPAHDAAATRMLIWAKAEFAAAFHEAVHSLAAEPGRAYRAHARLTRRQRHGRVLREGVAQLATVTHLDRALKASGMAAIEPAILKVPCEKNDVSYRAETGAVRGLVDSVAAHLETSPDAILQRLAADGGTTRGVRLLARGMAAKLTNDADASKALARDYERALLGPLVQLENLKAVLQPKLASEIKMGEYTAGAIRDGVRDVSAEFDRRGTAQRPQTSPPAHNAGEIQ